MGFGLAVVLAGLAPCPAGAQETLDQFNAANAENRRYTGIQSQLNNQALQLQNQQRNALQACAAIGSASGQGACATNLQIQTRQQGSALDNRAQQERNAHQLILQGIGVPPLQ